MGDHDRRDNQGAKAYVEAKGRSVTEWLFWPSVGLQSNRGPTENPIHRLSQARSIPQPGGR